MSRDVYSEINLHLTWHVKNDRNIITEAMERDLHQILQRRTHQHGAFFHGVGGTANHVHLVLSMLPSTLISTLVGRIKGGASHDLNLLPQWRKALEWQDGYGVVCFGTENLPWVLRYVKNQKLHHARGTTHDRLERLWRDDIAEAKQREAR
jgi:REP element-mobilizing transposase RayT